MSSGAGNGVSANAPAWYAGCSALRNHGVNPSQATDYPTRPWDLANLRKGNQRPHYRERRPSKSGAPAHHEDPTRHKNGLVPNAVAPTGRSNGE